MVESLEHQSSQNLRQLLFIPQHYMVITRLAGYWPLVGVAEDKRSKIILNTGQKLVILKQTCKMIVDN